MPELRDCLFFGNPIYEGLSRNEQRIEVLKKLPNLVKVRGRWRACTGIVYRFMPTLK